MILNVHSKNRVFLLLVKYEFCQEVQQLFVIRERRCGRVDYVSDVNILDENNRMQIGQRIQNTRIKRGLTGADLGAILDISANQVSRIETGKAKCSLEYIYILVQVLNCSADYLLFGKDESPNFSQEQVELIEKLYRSIQK